MTCEEILAQVAVLRAYNTVYQAAIDGSQQAINANNTQITILMLDYEAQGCGPFSSSSSLSSSSSSSSDLSSSSSFSSSSSR